MSDTFEDRTSKQRTTTAGRDVEEGWTVEDRTGGSITKSFIDVISGY